MKWNYIATFVAAVLLGATAYHWFTTNPDTRDYWEPTETREYIEVVDGEKIILDRPLTQSFSNAESNKEAAAKKQSTRTSGSQTFTQKVTQTLVRPFIVGMYYLDTLRNHAFDDCSNVSADTETRNDNPEEYISEDGEFEITKVEKSIDQTFVFVDTDAASEDICARFMISKSLKGINPLHIFINN